ncbi:MULTISPECIES: DinI-like family protein [Pantoea]|uniref:DinI family protein n=2 Tax=root TaxID=1 RepID=A0A7Y6TTR6_9GAMM|nr:MULTISPECIES: DinI-like family protein [Pantoea]DAF98624.1 MAG TPA: DinI-like family protein [Peduovirinae sp. ctOza1]MBZ6395598.1 DinI family protein [Pantoea sp.]MBZ6439222.1 DinI family protein [Pantoea sp.]NUY43584.1 DinI family protein [Pantoea brenneri]NUY51142.1 DinI family protein [Pantoea brenneri]
MRIEIMLDKNHKISQPVLDAFHVEVNRRVVALFPDAVVRVRQGSHTRIEMPGLKIDEDRRRVNDLLQNVWEDDSWLH